MRDLSDAPRADGALTYLRLTRMLDEVERSHPEVSGPLRLTLLRAHRAGEVGWLDEARFAEVLDDLVRHSA